MVLANPPQATALSHSSRSCATMTPATGRSILAGIIDLVSDFRRWLAVCQHLPLANCNRISGWPEFQDGAAAMVEAKERALIAHPPVAGFDLAILHGAWRDRSEEHTSELQS